MKSINSILTRNFLEKNFAPQNFNKYDKIHGILKKYIHDFNNLKIEKSILFIELSSSIQKFEINARKSEIIKEINLFLNNAIKDIKILISGKRNF